MKLISSKSGQMFMNGFPKGINFIFAILTILVGGVGMFGEIIGFSLPAIPGMIIYGLIAVAGLVLLFDGMMGSNGLLGMTMQVIPKAVNLLIGLVVAAGGAILFLGSMGIMNEFAIPQIVIYILLLVAGGILLLDTLVGVKQF